jgi:hypothetical protein
MRRRRRAAAAPAGAGMSTTARKQEGKTPLGSATDAHVANLIDAMRLGSLIAGDKSPELLLWSTALLELCQHENPRWMIELLRRHIPPPAFFCDRLADLLDPSKDAMGRLTLTKSRIWRSVERERKSTDIVHRILDAETAGDKRYLAVAQIAKQIGCSERHVWAMLKTVKGQIGSGERHDWALLKTGRAAERLLLDALTSGPEDERQIRDAIDILNGAEDSRSVFGE